MKFLLLSFFIFAAFMCCSAEIQGSRNITISMFATDLKKCDIVTPCDPYVIILCSSSLSDWKECGRTKKISQENYPVWPERFTFEHNAENQERWRFDVKDDNVIGHDDIGTVTVIVSDFVEELVKPKRYDLGGRGNFYLMQDE